MNLRRPSVLTDPRLHPRVTIRKRAGVWTVHIRILTPFRLLVLHHWLLAPALIVLLILWLLFLLCVMLAWLQVVHVLPSLGYSDTWVFWLLLVMTLLLWAESFTRRWPITTRVFGRVLHLQFRREDVIVGGLISGKAFPRSARPMFIATALGGQSALYASSANLGLLLDGTRYLTMAEVLEIEPEFSRQIAASLNLALELTAARPGHSDEFDMHALSEPPRRGLFFTKIASLFSSSPANN